ncbi:MAG TPA: ABC transporter ATP-binding protein [Propionibacterium sp.]|jgi:ABC-2 type transport system ATP-binding protein|nr:ABC transporter ATP-binding protein [Propionibacterium sp.]
MTSPPVHDPPLAASTIPALTATGVVKHYRATRAVDDVSLVVGQGETLGVLGPNGAGKTTLVELIAGVRVPDRGRVTVLGLDPGRDRARVRQVLGVQLQSADLHNALTVGELVDLFRSFYPDPRDREEILELVQLTEQRGTRFEKLSGGQQQRLSVALALVGRPRIVILDELTTGLDPRARRRIWATIEHLRAEGVTVLLVSHAMDEVERLCDRVVVLVAGRVVVEGTPARVRDEVGAPSLEEAFVILTGTEIDDLEEDSA